MKYSQHTIEMLEKEFSTSVTQGLTSQQADKALKKYGKNTIIKKHVASLFTIIVQQCMNPLVYVLAVSAVIIFFTGTLIDTCIVFFIIIFNCIIGSIQEYRLTRIVHHLESLQKRDYIALRDGQKTVVSQECIVPGDIIVLQDGQKIPADGRLVVAYDIVVDESMLTGESKPVKKTVHNNETNSSDRLDMQHTMIFANTTLVSGYGQMLVTATGKQTESGKIESYIPDIVTDLPLQQDLKRLIKFVLITIICICIALLILGLLDGKPFAELFAALLALFMCAVPQGLPVIMTLILAVGSYRLAKHNILAKRLQAVEGLGRADILVVDKTGTLTSNQLMVTSIVAGPNRYMVSGSGYVPEGTITYNGVVVSGGNNDPLYQKMIEAAALLDRSQITFNHDIQRYMVQGNVNDAALGVCAKKSDISLEMLTERFILQYEIPFHSDTQVHICFYKDTYLKSGVIYAVGSAEGFYLLGVSKELFNSGDMQQALAEGARIMVSGYGTFDDSAFEVVPNDDDEKKEYYVRFAKEQLACIGFFEVEDALRINIADTVKTIQDAGIALIMATGDHINTAEHIARQAGILQQEYASQQCLEMTTHTLSQDEFAKTCDEYVVFGRCLPTDKLNIITALQNKGYKVAMVGDGVNDVPSLSLADLGIAMGSTGSDSAKHAADMVLLQDSFETIPFGIAEGRHIFYTFKRVIFYFLASNFTEVLVMTVAFIGFPLPLLASHVLWLNLVTDGFLDASLSLEQPEDNVLEQKFKRKIKHLISVRTIIHIIVLAAISAALTGVVYIVYLDMYEIERARTMCMVTLTACQMINAVNSRSLHRSIFQSPLWGNPWLYAALVGITVALISIIYIPSLQIIFKTVSLSLSDWMTVVIVAVLLLIIEEIRKRVFFFL